ncbi:Ankyrin repeat-containing domain protein [Niveomyces insectorum RCEF 264]|uniref:Ankyrin repeat-containing domain protein n=1 Tax=Niveomyces insectorum RCEF 264 TaxID=1081102 RepID=A0A167MN21_9HYPO|nr:Ankyrin repeat-containing domain protein [Niveomyces insectorum RCEF 264]
MPDNTTTDVPKSTGDGHGPLHTAAKTGDIDAMRQLLEGGADISARDNDQWTALHYAARYKQAAAVDLLLEKGADIDPRSKTGRTPLMFAAEKGHKEIVELLLERHADATLRTNDEWSLLHCAVRFGHEDIVRLCLERYHDLLETQDDDKWTPLHFAAWHGHRKAAQCLLDCNANIEARSKSGYTPLMAASEKGYKLMVGFLLGRGAHTETRSDSKQTALHVAAHYGHEAVARVLLQADANPEARDKDRWTALHFATYYDREAVARLLLENDANPVARDDQAWTVLHFAVHYKKDAIARLLVESGTHLECGDQNKWTVLHHAAHSGDANMAQLLLDHHANVAARTIDNCTPLMLASEMGHASVVKLLLDRHSDVEASDDDKWTPLHFAARHGRDDVVQVLVDRHADVHVQSKAGNTALKVAEKYKQKTTARLLREIARHSKDIKGSDGSPPSNKQGQHTVDSADQSHTSRRKHVLTRTKTHVLSSETCSSLDFKEILGGGKSRHHSSFEALQASGNNGCGLCKLLVDAGSNDGTFCDAASNSSDDGNAIFCEVAWGEFDAFYDVNPNTKYVSRRSGKKHKNAPYERFLSCEDDPYVNKADGTPIQAIRFFSESFSCSVRVCTTADDPLAAKLPYRLVESDCSSEGSFGTIKRWLKSCLQRHDEFCQYHLSPMPTRVVHVGTEESKENPRLVVTGGQLGDWAALSHCWGPKPHFTTTTLNLQERTESIPFDDLPATFRDAVTVCRRLGIEYLWIDSLCILQDSAEDWRAESEQMSNIYTKALLTIVAEASPDSRNGIFAAANAKRPPRPMQIPCVDEHGSRIGTIYPAAATPRWFMAEDSADNHMYRPGPVTTRAWTFQEDILSPRVLRFAGDQLSWTCLTTYHKESDPVRFNGGDVVYSPKSFRRKDMIKAGTPGARTPTQFWYAMVERYNRRALTFEKDKLPAISGIAREVGAITKQTYKAGLWLEDIHMGLRWSTNGTGRRHAAFTAPSWSWASLSHDNEDFYHRYFGQWERLSQIITVDVETVGTDPYGEVTKASLEICGPCHGVDDAFERFEHRHRGNQVAEDLQKDSKKSYFDWDDEMGQKGHGIICMQIAKVGGTIDALLLEPVDEKGSDNTYQRVGVVHYSGKKNGGKLAEGWNVRTITII